MVYRFVFRWGISAGDLIGNHYYPHYYGVTRPEEYALWLRENDVTLWIYTGGKGYPVYATLEKSYPGLLVPVGDVLGTRIFTVDFELLDEILSGYEVESAR